MHTRWNRIGPGILLAVIVIAGSGCRERDPDDQYPTNLGSADEPLLPPPSGTFGGRMSEGSAKIVVYEPGEPADAAEGEPAPAPVEQPAAEGDDGTGEAEPPPEPPPMESAGTDPSADDEAAIRELCQAVADAGLIQLDRFVVPDQQARVGEITGPLQDLADLLTEISDGFAESAPQAAAEAQAARERIVGRFIGAADSVTGIRLLDADRATAKRGQIDVLFERAGDRWLVRIPDLVEEGRITEFTNALRDLVDAMDAVLAGLEEGEMTDAVAVERMTTATQQFASQMTGPSP
jgi:hypothetical protein